MKHRAAIIILSVALFLTSFFIPNANHVLLFCGIILILFLIVLAVGITTPKFNYFIRSINKLQPGEVCLSFDDGPNTYTHQILDCLAKHEIKASFFLIGKNSEADPDTVKRIQNGGHLIGNHSYHHQTNIGWLSTKKVGEEISKANDILADITGKQPLYYRPPFGVLNPNIARAIKNNGLKSVGWTIRSFDTKIQDPVRIFNKIKKRFKNKGEIILLHDTCKHSVETLDLIIPYLKEQGVKFVNP
ncbi:polysaccharide deacetylase family protein [Crocinitomix catalasitica]|uniref:polysaccharide deacetylase family protein n=1 Tax=Crocinitomix catalasitica TaxID=184607 RepID=UPI0005637BBA|nr:polysaccharide deacetylase family protein [Crocinitomix catalasitica]